jgi:hypothetical protein
VSASRPKSNQQQSGPEPVSDAPTQGLLIPIGRGRARLAQMTAAQLEQASIRSPV